MNMPGKYQRPVAPETGLAWPRRSYRPPTSEDVM